jgi:class 3 adenylate cyclase/hemoglobin-like flavoprotein
MAKLVYHDEGVVAEVGGDATILEAALRHKIPHAWECGGRGRCTTCRVRVLDGARDLSPRTAREVSLAQARGWDPYTRLACQARVRGDVVVQRLVRNGADALRIQAEELRGEPGKEVPLAVLFCDLRDFTRITERHLAYDVVHILNRYYERIGEAVVYNGGYIYQYVGDELVAWFGLRGGDGAEHCLNAVRAALAMRAILEEVNAGLRDDFDLSLAISIGIHYGPAIVGTIGHASHKQLAAVGDTVNVTSRIEALNRELGTTLLVSDEVLRRLPATVATGTRAAVTLKGKSEPSSLVEVTGFTEPDALLLVQTTFERVLGDPDRFGRAFYARLFELLPPARAMFRGDMKAQTRMFVDVLRAILHGLARFDEIAPSLREEGRRHVAYGTRAEHFPILVQAFADALRVVMGEGYDAQVERAWITVMERIAATMLEGMQAAPPAAARPPASSAGTAATRAAACPFHSAA